jgi:hypothetical protein
MASAKPSSIVKRAVEGAGAARTLFTEPSRTYCLWLESFKAIVVRKIRFSLRDRDGGE